MRELYRQLLSEGVQPWFDEINLLPGQDWKREIRKAVHSSDVIIVCLSRDSITKAGYIQEEIRYALDAADEQPEDTIFIIPLKLEECEVPERLQRWQWVNLFDETGYTRLISALQVRAKEFESGTAPPLDSRSKQPLLKEKLKAASHDPIWQMISAIIAIITLCWAVSLM